MYQWVLACLMDVQYCYYDRSIVSLEVNWFCIIMRGRFWAGGFCCRYGLMYHSLWIAVYLKGTKRWTLFGVLYRVSSSLIVRFKH